MTFEHEDPWTEDDIAKLTRLWMEGVPQNEIGRRIGRSKNSVNGKRKRLGLPGRESPIKKRPPGTPPARIRGITRADIAKAVLPSLGAPVLLEEAAEEVGVDADDGAVVVLRRRRVTYDAAHRGCVWPEGDPGAESFRFCGAAVDLGHNYCTAHARIAFVPRRGDRAA